MEQIGQFLPMLLIIVVFYFFMIRPQMKKDHKKFVEELKKGDKVITTSGIHGKIVEMNDSTFLIEVESGTKIRFEKSSVSLESSKALSPTATK
jgi:preprotein translocase subunit YajC